MLTVSLSPYPGFDEIFPIIQRLSHELGIQLTFVGAGARNVWLELKGNTRQRRNTKDIDIAIFATDRQNYEQVRQYFVEKEGFRISPHFELTLFTPDGVQLDLLPYGPIEVNHEIQLGRMTKAAQVHGFQEACDHAVSVQYQDIGEFRVITVGGLIILKLIALNDRPQYRYGDAEDIGLFLLETYDLFLEQFKRGLTES